MIDVTQETPSPRMDPDVQSRDLEHASEEPVYVALRDQLGDDYAVLHSYPWLRPWRGEALLEGEADFVVVHPQRGIVVLEVKGGDVSHDGRRWFRDTSTGPRPSGSRARVRTRKFTVSGWLKKFKCCTSRAARFPPGP